LNRRDKFGVTSPRRGEVGLLPAMRSIVRCNPGEAFDLTIDRNPSPDLLRKSTSPKGEVNFRCRCNRTYLIMP
jgi:hypothetical protein